MVKANKRVKDSGFGLFYEANKFYFQVGSAIVAVAFTLLIWSQSNSSIQNLVNVSDDALKSVFLGDKPHVLYCIKGNSQEEKPHPLYNDLNQAKGSKYGFAMVNCSQVLPSGASIMKRFDINKKVRPTIFLTAPWFGGKAKQLQSTHMKDLKTMRKAVDTLLAPRATEVFSDKDLNKYCNFNAKTYTDDDKSIGHTCLVFVKGKRHSKTSTDLEEKIIRAYPRQKYISLDGVKRRLSFEDVSDSPADTFALKVYALRNGTHHMTMSNPSTWDFMNTFVSHAVGTPLYAFMGSNKKAIGIKKTGVKTSSFRDRSQKAQKPQPPKEEEDDTPSTRRRKRKAAKTSTEGSDDDEDDLGETSSEAEPEAPELTPEEIEAARIEKERRAREYMDKLAQESMFEEVDEEEVAEGGEGEEEDEDLIEL